MRERLARQAGLGQPWLALLTTITLVGCASVSSPSGNPAVSSPPASSPSAARLPPQSGSASFEPSALRPSGPSASSSRSVAPGIPLAIAGRATDDTGRPAGGLIVRACPSGGHPSSRDCRSTTTAEDGTYLIRDLGEGTYVVDFADPSGRLARGFADRGGAYHATPEEADAFWVDGAGVVDADVRLPPGLEIAGTVSTPDGAVAAGIAVTACQGERSDWGCVRAVSGADGQYRVTGLLDRAYVVSVASEARFGEGYYRADGWTNAFGEATPVSPGPRLDLRLVPSHRISGRVTDVGGGAMQGMDVFVSPAGVRSAPATTDAAGAYEIAGLIPATYEVTCLCPSSMWPGGDVATPISVVITDRDALSVDIQTSVDSRTWVGPEASPWSVPVPTAIPDRATGAGPLRPDQFARVVADDLVVRSEPRPDAGSRILAHLGTGDVVFVAAGPVAASGYSWYQVAGSYGWVASASRAGETWLQGLALACPALPVALEQLQAMSALERLACFGDTTLTFVGYAAGVGFADGPACGACQGTSFVGAICSSWGIADEEGRDVVSNPAYAPGVAPLTPSDAESGTASRDTSTIRAPRNAGRRAAICVRTSCARILLPSPSCAAGRPSWSPGSSSSIRRDRLPDGHAADGLTGSRAGQPAAALHLTFVNVQRWAAVAGE